MTLPLDFHPGSAVVVILLFAALVSKSKSQLEHTTHQHIQCAIYLLSLATYNVYFHPLAAFPGPKLWAATRIPFAYHLCSGDLVFRIKDLHQSYGHVVRTGPDELSYTSNVWKDIYGLRRGHAEFRKDGRFYPADGHIITANSADHTRIRRLLAHAFSETALRGQEALILRYVDLLVAKLRENCGSGKNPLDVVNYYNWTTFDLIGDLTLGESFGCLHDATYHPWVSLIFEGVKAATFGQATRYFPGMTRLLQVFVPQNMMDKKDAHEALSRERVLKRVSQGVNRSGTVDFMTEVLAHNDDDGKDSDGRSRGMSVSELATNASLVIIAGSETTATLLSGVTYLLLTHPFALTRAVEEVRTAFEQDSDINFASVSRLRYMIACLEEALRLYPPAPIGLPRSIPGKGATIDGVWVPGGVRDGLLLLLLDYLSCILLSLLYQT